MPEGKIGPRCGTRYSYVHLRCRCVLCTEANREHQRSWRAKKKEVPKHGTSNGYFNYGCKCDPCKDAGSAANKRNAQRRKERLAAKG